MNSIPKSWKWVKIKDVSEKSQYGFTTKAVKEGDVYLLRTTDITNGDINWEQVPFCRDNPDEIDKYRLEEGDVLISRAGSVGESFLINNLPFPNIVFASYLIRFKPTINRKYFKYFLQSPNYWNAITENQSGIAVPNVNATKLNAIKLPLPPEETQNRIVEKIEELFSELDHGVENLKKAQKQLKTYRQAVLKDAFEGKLTKEWREQQDDLPTPEELLQQIKAERKAHRQRELAEWEKEVEQWEKDGKPGRKPRKPTKLSKLDEDSISNTDGLPNGWFYIPFEQIGYWQGGGTPSKRKEEFWNNGTVAWVSPKDMKRKDISETEDYITENAIENSSAKWIKKGSILFVVRSGILRRILPVAVAKTNLTVNQDLQAFTSVTQTLPDYLYWYAFGNENAIRNSCAKDGTTVESIDSSSLKAYPIPFCSFKEQEEIVNEIESRLSVVDQLEQTIKENLQKAEALRQSILKKAFSGELVTEETVVEEVEITPFQQIQMIGVLIDILKEEYDMAYGEMAIAKFLFLVDRIKKYRTGFSFKEWHWGPYDPKIKKRIFTKDSFFTQNEYSSIELNEKRDQLFKYKLREKDKLETGVREIADIISQFKGKKKTSRQLELLATVCKVIENENSIDLSLVRKGMKKWKTDKTKFKNKAEKFSEIETQRCIQFVLEKNWDKMLFNK